MQNLIQLIEKRSQQLFQNPLCHWINSEETKHLPPQEILAFAPSMLFFIMGFKDILENLEYANPRDQYELMVNQHCAEDKDHWRWYLQDLKTLGFDESHWGPDLFSKVETLWSSDHKPTRDLVYLCIYLIKKFRSAKASLVIIECLEATFGVFMTSLQKRFWNSPIYAQLQFFGQTHHHQEANHSIGHWIEDDGLYSRHAEIENIQFSQNEQEELTAAIQIIFEQFELVFESWFSARKHFLPKHASIPRQLELN